MPATARGQPGSSRIGRAFTKLPPPVSDPIHKDTAETLLRKLIEQNDPRYAPAGYILAVMLERKRVLKVKEQIVRDGKRVFIYEQPGPATCSPLPTRICAWTSSKPFSATWPRCSNTVLNPPPGTVTAPADTVTAAENETAASPLKTIE
jgi:hypothetical protein